MTTRLLSLAAKAKNVQNKLWNQIFVLVAFFCGIFNLDLRIFVFVDDSDFRFVESADQQNIIFTAESKTVKTSKIQKSEQLQTSSRLRLVDEF